MDKNDVQLIRRILSGDDAAFTTLVGKYQKSVHALAWRKIGDFHIAEEITQDTFLQAYKKLSTLRNPNQFAGWLYVIATNLCKRWHQKKKLPTQSLEGTPMTEIEKSSYKHYASEQLETETTEHHHEIVKKLLQRLPESERTVVTLHYLGDMSIKEIGRFLGVSANTINSRLRRARKRLQEREELLIQEVLGSVQLPANLMENIGRQVANMNPPPPAVTKPLVPWAAIGTTAILAMLALGTGNRYLDHFQKPYSFEAQAEPTIEIVDARIVLDIDAKPALRNPIEGTLIPSEDDRTDTPVDPEIPDSHKSEAQFLALALAQETPSQDTAKDELNFKELVAAIKHHHALLKSGEGEVVYTLGVPPFDTDTHSDLDTEIITGTIAFNTEKTRFHSEKSRFDPPGKTTLLTPIGAWEIVPHKHRKTDYSFNNTEEPRLINPFHDVDPRRWLTLRSKDLATYLRIENFQVTGREIFKNSLCYVLEAKDGKKSEKIWIAPERGFQYLKHEYIVPRPVDALDSDIPMEALTISRTTISYQQHGEVWFPKVVFDEYAWLDFKPEDPIISGQMLEIKNFKINHDIPPETFTVDIPDDAMITVNQQNKKLSKAEFLKQYGQQDELDLKALLAAIKHHDTLLKSGEGEVVYTDEQPPVEADTRIVSGRIAFDSENTRFDSQREITILTPTEMWQIVPHRQRHPKYYFSPEPRSLIHDGVDPRRWLIKDLATHLESENFQITEREVFNDILCYVLETKQGDTVEKIWIAPERGFRYLKREVQFPRPVDALDSDIPMEALTIIRTTISYQQFGETWFPKAVFSEYAWLDFKATYPIISRERLELKNFKVNHNLPPDTFTVDIPDDEMIRVTGINKPLTKQEFLKRYKQQIDN